LEGEGTEIEWQALERSVGAALLGLGDSSASTGGESIFGSPLGVCDLEKIGLSAGIQDAIGEYLNVENEGVAYVELIGSYSQQC
jgi:hypothetical protein